MKLLLKNTIILLLFCFLQIYGQSSWRADLRVYDESYIGGEGNKELNVNMIVDLYYNNVPYSPQSNYKYEFFKKLILEPNPEWIEFSTSPQWGNNIQGTHAYQDSTLAPAGKFDIYCFLLY